MRWLSSAAVIVSFALSPSFGGSAPGSGGFAPAAGSAAV